MYLLRRSALRIAFSPHSSSVLKSRSITSISRSTTKLSPRSTQPFLQRRWASENTTDALAEAEGAAPAGTETEAPIATETQTSSEGTSSQADPLESISEAVQSVPTQYQPKSTLYVGNLFFDVTEEDIQKEFQRFGTLTSATIVRDVRGLSKGFGYVEFGDVEAARSAKDTMNQTIYEGRRITVQYAQRRSTMTNRTAPTNPPSKTLFIGNMSYEMTDRDLNEMFKGIRNVIDVRVAIDRRTGQPRGFAHADFIDVKSAVEAMAVLKERGSYGRQLRLDFSTSYRPSAPGASASGGSAPPSEQTGEVGSS